MSPLQSQALDALNTALGLSGMAVEIDDIGTTVFDQSRLAACLNEEATHALLSLQPVLAAELVRAICWARKAGRNERFANEVAA